MIKSSFYEARAAKKKGLKFHRNIHVEKVQKYCIVCMKSVKVTRDKKSCPLCHSNGSMVKLPA